MQRNTSWMTFFCVLLSMAFGSFESEARKPKERDLLPDIAPVAPLPSVYRKIRITSAPDNVIIEVKHGTKILPCAPANRTPCVVEVVGYSLVQLDITIRHQGQEIRYRKKLEGRSMQEDLWLLKIPVIQNPTWIMRPTVLPKRTLPPTTPPMTPTPSKGISPWIWVVAGVVVVGGAIAGIAAFVVTRDQIGLQMGAGPRP